MPNYLAVIKRVAQTVAASPAFDRTIAIAAGYVISEMRLTDLRAKKVFLKRKRTNHLRILGRTVYRLSQNDIDAMADSRVAMIVKVIGEIDTEIITVENELERRKSYERERRQEERARRSENRKTT